MILRTAFLYLMTAVCAFSQAPSQPHLFSIPARRNPSVKLVWDTPTNGWAAYYHVYYGTAPGFYTNFTVATNTAAIVTNLTRGVIYWFAASSLNDTGESALSDPVSNAPFSNTVVSVIAQAAPSISGPWTNLSVPPIFIQTNPPGNQFFRLSIQQTNF